MYSKWRLALVIVVIFIAISCKKNKASGFPGPGDDDSDTLVVKPPEPEVYTQKAVYNSVGSNIGGFYEALPLKYDSASPKKYPLLVVLHGGGELGNGTDQLSTITRNGITRLIDKKKMPASFTVDGQTFSFIILSPQFKVWPRVDDLTDLINYASANYKIDPERIYMVGLSMGGGATWEYAAQHGDKLAAIVPICGATWAVETTAKKLAATNVPTWAFHNMDDSVVSVSYTTRYLDFIVAANPSFPYKLTLWDTGGHDSWTKATDPELNTDGKNIYEWMLQFKR